MPSAGHWDARYASAGADAVSWHEARPGVSLELLDALGVGRDQSVIDVGGGASRLVDHLLARGHQDVAVLDLSGVALAEAQRRVQGAEVTWIVADLLTWRPARRWDVWHDRAVLHFLLSDTDRATYCRQLRRAVGPDGAFVIGCFAEDGPTQCSGLPVRRHSQQELVELLRDVDVVEVRRQVHRTPGGTEQPFNWLAGRLRPAAREQQT